MQIYTHALYDLAAHPEYVAPLREEIESVVGEGRWTRLTIAMMRKLDYFLKEVLRRHHLASGNNHSNILKDSIGSPVVGVHNDESIYENTNEFDGFRFLKLWGKHGDLAKDHTVNKRDEITSVGTSQHKRCVPLLISTDEICPVSFLAETEIKTMLAFTIMRYDVRTKDGNRPMDHTFQNLTIPNIQAELLFRRRC